MHINDDEKDCADLERLTAEITRNLYRCRKFLLEPRSELAANLNIPELLDEES